jgi:hypothetical protein
MTAQAQRGNGHSVQASNVESRQPHLLLLSQIHFWGASSFTRSHFHTLLAFPHFRRLSSHHVTLSSIITCPFPSYHPQSDSGPPCHFLIKHNSLNTAPVELASRQQSDSQSTSRGDSFSLFTRHPQMAMVTHQQHFLLLATQTCTRSHIISSPRATNTSSRPSTVPRHSDR